MAQYFYDFSEYTEGDVSTYGSPDWSVLNSGTGDWTRQFSTAGTPSAGKTVRFARSASSSAGNCIVSDEAGGTTGDIEIVARFKLSGTATTGYAFGPCLAAATTNAYGLILTSGTTVSLTRFATATGSGQTNALDDVAITFTVVSDTYFWIRIGRSGSTIRAKVWSGNAGDEPGSWSREGTDTGITTAKAGLYGYRHTQAPFYFDLVGIGTAGDSAPSSGGGSFKSAWARGSNIIIAR